jgi:biopolymer transport protein ExbD
VKIEADTEEHKLEINLTPMIDVVFLLIIFFMVATKFAEIERDLRVNPPSAESAQPVTAPPKELIVNVTRDGRYIINGVEFPPADLEQVIAQAARQNPDQAVIVRGDKQTILQLPVDVLSLCEKYQVKRKYLTTTQPGT